MIVIAMPQNVGEADSDSSESSSFESGSLESDS